MIFRTGVAVPSPPPAGARRVTPPQGAPTGSWLCHEGAGSEADRAWPDRRRASPRTFSVPVARSFVTRPRFMGARRAGPCSASRRLAARCTSPPCASRPLRSPRPRCATGSPISPTSPKVLSAELDDRDARCRERRIHEARFPRLKHLADFDLAAAPTVDPALLATLERGEWIAAGQPVVLLGDSDTGKSHLLIGLGMAACQRGLRVRYTTGAALVNELAEAADERTLSRVVARYGRLDLLCLDEFGYVHLDPRGGRTALPDPHRA